MVHDGMPPSLFIKNVCDLMKLSKETKKLGFIIVPYFLLVCFALYLYFNNYQTGLFWYMMASPLVSLTGILVFVYWIGKIVYEVV